MTAADIPTTHGIPNNGFEGFRFLGYPPYDAPGELGPPPQQGQAGGDRAWSRFSEWHGDEANPLRWVFTVRSGVKFHDGSEFNADAVMWNLRRIYDDKSPQYDAPAAPIVQGRRVDGRQLREGRRQDHRHDDQVSVQLPAVVADARSNGQPDAVGEGRQELGGVREAAGRHRAVQDHQGGARPVCRDVAQRGLLGQGAGSQARQDGRLSDAGSDHARRSVAVWSGGLDRGARAGFAFRHCSRQGFRSVCGRIHTRIPTC